jgi:hypothetical protein
MSPMNGWGRVREEDRPNAMVGAARRVHITDRNDVTTLRARAITADQALAWDYWDSIGEIKQSYLYLARVASRVRLFAGYQSDQGDAPVPIGAVGGISRSLVVAARQEMARLGLGPGGQPQLIQSALLNFLVPGECYLVGNNGSWSIRSTSEIYFEDSDDPNRRVRIVSSRTKAATQSAYLPANAYVARIWRSHPRFTDDPDSALLGLLDDCRDFQMISRVMRASGHSRLNAGLLYVADELRFQRATDPGSDDDPTPDVDAFEEEMQIALSDPIGNTDSPSEVLPLFVRGPREFAKDGIVPINIARDISENDLKWFDTIRTRILSSLDVPTDLITGLKEVRYSNARTISEDFLKSYIEPMIVLLCEGLTSVFLRPRLIQMGYDPEFVKNIHVWYDPSEIVTRPDRSEDANQGHDRGVISDQSWRKAHGFSELDAPTARERLEKIIFEGGLIPPQNIIDFLRLIDPQTVLQVQKMAMEASKDEALAPINGAAPTDTPPGQTPGPNPAIAAPSRTADNPAVTEPPEGHLPGGVNGRPPASQAPAAALWLPSERVDWAEMVAAAAALAATTAPEVRERTRALEQNLELERRLRDALSVQLNDLVQRALERAGARAVSKVRNDPDRKAMVASVPIEEAFAALPELALEELALDPRQLVSDTIDRGKAAFTSLVARTQQQGWRTLGGHVLDEMTESQPLNLERAWAWLRNRLVTIAVERLRQPGRGENYVSMDVVRDATTLAGGGSHDDSGVGVGASRPQDSGRAILSERALQITGWTFSDRKRWVYGISENHFQPHRELDGVVFEEWNASELSSADPEAWPYATHYYPGDHNGCRCDWLPEVILVPGSADV